MASVGQDDWTRGEFADPNAGIDDYEFGAGPVATHDADEIERDAESRNFKPIEPGDHELVVDGFFKAPELVLRQGYLHGRPVSWSSAKVGVRLAKVDDPQCTILDFFDLPPNDPDEHEAYLNASKGPEGKNPGFMSEKFGHFIARLGWPYPKGGELPDEARRLGNWKGRRVHATVELQKQDMSRINQQTGEPFPPRSQIKLFSYRPSEQTITGQATRPVASAAAQSTPPSSSGRPGGARPGAPAQPQSATRRAPIGTSPAARVGLNDL